MLSEQSRRVRGAVSRMLHRQLSMAWEQWQYVAGVLSAERRALEAAARKLRNRQVLGGWNAWRQLAAEMRRQKQLLSVALRHMVVGNFYWWWKVAVEAASQTVQKSHALHLARQHCNFSMMVHFWRRWCMIVECQVDSKDAIHAALVHHRTRSLRSASASWSLISHKRKEWHALTSWMQRFLVRSNSIALSGIVHASPARLGVLQSSMRMFACQPSADLRLQRYAQQVQAAHVAHLALRRAVLTLRRALDCWVDCQRDAQSRRKLQDKSRQAIGTLLLRGIQTASQTLRVERMAIGLTGWHTYTLQARQARGNRFKQGLAAAHQRVSRQRRHAVQLALRQLRSHSAFKHVTAEAANQRFVMEERQRLEQKRLVGAILAHYMRSASAELYIRRMTWGFGLWQTYVTATQQQRRASFGAHLSGFVRHSRRIVMQWGFRRWLIWTWQDRYELLDQQFGLCQHALADLETDVKRLENENAELENSRAHAIAERDSLSIDVQVAEEEVRMISSSYEQLTEQSGLLQQHAEELQKELLSPASGRASKQTKADAPGTGMPTYYGGVNPTELSSRGPVLSPSQLRTATWDDVINATSEQIEHGSLEPKSGRQV